MEILAAAGIALLLVGVVAVRRHLCGRQLFAITVGWGIQLWIALVILVWGIEMLPRPGDPHVAGLLMVGVGGISLILGLRGLLDRTASTSLMGIDGELSGRDFDYLIWVFLGVPLLMGVGIVMLVLLGQA